ncbi:MAG: hypothetical protein RMJ36_00360 [Candidatus Calescibacterium sp.]|nr:DUF177 domain-containing protein [Candidatus Calescibacterium sp.]MDW8132097.1 hypothetical protein [Candidatus Calescibacterium sp.]
MIVKYNQNLREIFVIDLQDLISSKVDFIFGTFHVDFDPSDIVGLYSYENFKICCQYNIKKVGDSFLIKISIRSSLPVFCDVCGNKFDYSFSLDVEEIYTSYFEYKQNIEDMYYFIFNGKYLDIGKICIENFISNLPMRFQDGCKK